MYVLRLRDLRVKTNDHLNSNAVPYIVQVIMLDRQRDELPSESSCFRLYLFVCFVLRICHLRTESSAKKWLGLSEVIGRPR